MNLSPQDNILKSVLLFETIVQVIEFAFYIWFVLRFSLSTMAATRYFDWVITTPTMLFTTIVFMKYQELREKQLNTNFTIIEFINKNYSNICIITLSNFCMLLFGYLGEINLIDKNIASIAGFIFFGITFYTIYNNYAKQSVLGQKLFIFLILIWGLYGVVYLLDIQSKNIGFNMLDIIAKNFFGMYLVYAIYQKSITV